MSRFVALVLVLLASRVAAASTHDAAEAGFVKRVVDAINTPETARAAALLHPTSLVCPSEYKAAMSFFDPRLGAKGPVPPTFTWRMEEAPAGPPMFSDRVGYPVRPSHLLHITYEARPNASTTLIVQTVRDAGRWYVTAFCPRSARSPEHGRRSTRLAPPRRGSPPRRPSGCRRSSPACRPRSSNRSSTSSSRGRRSPPSGTTSARPASI